MFSVSIEVLRFGGQPLFVRYELDADPDYPRLWRMLPAPDGGDEEDLRVAISGFSANWSPREVIGAAVEDFLLSFPELFQRSYGVLIHTTPITPVVS